MKYKIGVDGGATKTECILVDETGAVVARHLAPGCSPSLLDSKAAARVVTQALASLLDKSPAELRSSSNSKARAPRAKIVGLLLCLAGNRKIWQDFAGSLSGYGRVVAVDDSLPVLELATGGRPGLVLHGGTGSFVAARTGIAIADNFGTVHYAGGLGWRLGDPGSGYDLGRRAVARALLELQGWMSASGVSALVCEHSGLSEAGAISRYFYAQSGVDPRIASLAPGILRLAAARDAAAHAMVADSTSKLLDLAVQVATKLFPTRPIRRLKAGLTGPILTDPTVVKILLRRSPFALDPVKEPAIEGVRRLLPRI